MLETQELPETSHVTGIVQTGLHNTTASVQTGSKTGLGTKIIECLRRVASGESLPNMGQIMQLNMSVPQFSLKEVRAHSDSSSCWIVIDDKVYDITNFLNNHPGGEEIILENAGSDATIPFVSKGHSGEATELLKEYYIGDLTQKDRRYKT